MKAFNGLAKILLLICLGWCGLATVACAGEIYAHIELMSGTVSIIDVNGQARMPRVDDTIYAGETVITGQNGEMQARTEDHGFIVFRGNSKMKIESYLAKGGNEDNVVVTLLYGGLRSITGWIGKRNPGNYAIRTSNATIGIRGTDHETQVILPPEKGEASPTPPGTYDKVNTGATVIKTEFGQAVVNASQAGFAAHDSKVAPRLLERIPAIFKRSANEERIEKRSGELGKDIEQKRLERVKDIAERKNAAKEEGGKKVKSEHRRKPAAEK